MSIVYHKVFYLSTHFWDFFKIFLYFILHFWDLSVIIYPQPPKGGHIMSDIANRILQLINKKELTYSSLSKSTGIPKSALQRYATGETPKIPLDRLEAIAGALGVSAAYLMGWEEMQKNNDILSDVVIRARTDSEFLEALKLIYALDREKLSSLLSFLK